MEATAAPVPPPIQPLLPSLAFAASLSKPSTFVSYSLPSKFATSPRRRLRRHAAPPTRALLDESVAVVLSHHEAAAFFKLRALGSSLEQQDPPFTTASGEWSANLGRDTLTSVTVTPAGLVLGGGMGAAIGADSAQVTFGELKKMSKKGKVGAYEVYADGLTEPDRIAAISDLTARTASLQPHVAGAPPTVALGGFGMHRFKGTHPGLDTEAKVEALRAACGGVVRGRALDVCTGLGYTAIALAGCGEVTGVVTVELDPVIADVVSRRNPWSEGLFRDEKIERRVGDAYEVLQTFDDASFDSAIHDPPAQAMGGELYSLSFYRELRRVLRPGRKCFHYIGDPTSVESGRLFRGVGDRLVEAGFRDVRIAKEAFGVTATAARV